MQRTVSLAFLSAIFFLSFSLYDLQSYAQQHAYPPEVGKWDADSLGNQRAVVRVNQARPVSVRIWWRNRNVRPNQEVYVVDSATARHVPVSSTSEMGPESGVVSFVPASGAGIYYVYYLPYYMGGRSRSYPDAVYKTREMSSAKMNESGKNVARLIRLEAIDTFNSNYPMEVIATKAEVAKLKDRLGEKPFFVFPEKRQFPIKMRAFLPSRWVNTNVRPSFSDTVDRNTYFTFQLGVWAHKTKLEDVNVKFTDLRGPGNSLLKSDSLLCFNLEGTDYTGKAMRKRVDVEDGTVQSMWTGVYIPKNLTPGTYKGEAIVTATGQTGFTIPIAIEVGHNVDPLGGIDKPELQTRLHWLNSTLYQENTVIDPYTPIQVSGNTLSILGRSLVINERGFPGQIKSYFTPAMTQIGEKGKELLKGPFAFNIELAGGQPLSIQSSGIQFLRQEPGIVTWKANNSSPQMDMQVEGSLEFDGYVQYRVKIIARQELDVKDIALHIPLAQDAARYVMGLGRKGGFLKEDIHWKWEVEKKNQDGMWLGDVNAGMQLTLKDERYERPLNTNFYLQKPLILPSSWGNGEKGGVDILRQGEQVNVRGFSGARTMRVGDTLYYNFSLLITPFHPLNTKAQWNERYYHAYKPIDSVVKSGSNVINVHHGNSLNPYINYPFIATREMKSYIDSAHRVGLKVKIYNTVREVANRVYELYPMRSLGTEVFSSGPGKGYSWLQEHLHEDYIAAWYVGRFKDAAIINSGMSRWHNYYVEGMDWLVKNIGIDGIYLDDVAFDRITMKRIKRAMTQGGHPGLIDLHSANQYNERDGYNNSANLYLEHFPYINRLWFGEYFDYEEGTPDFFMTEVSGIPFGLMGEMLQDGGNPYRGLIYGMTSRMPYMGKWPHHIWKAWDDFGIQGSEMLGYWVDDCPVKTDNPRVLATVYRQNGKAMVALASWAPGDTSVKLEIDWKALGIDPKTARIEAPEVKEFQTAASYTSGQSINIAKNQGCLLIIE